ncbi:fibrinolytic enzyme, isozyme C-like [Gigantopelta aegis]|uniref:fibrinolytic enzyme, isozyme C-like n=1 Tax=Gigantopelta aegis TaxID=1735272 RepID=UPI001B88D3EE|nr:fibrinolytic enzyme, isozyme C-like [Gigantopelta aegis]
MTIIALLIVLAFAAQSLGSPTNYIVGVSAADIADFPYQCSLRYSDSRTCGCHENYNDGSGTFANDVAVIALSSDLAFTDNIKAANLSLPTDPDYDGDDCILTGWGHTNTGTLLPDKLLQLTTTGLSRAECQSAMSGISGVDIQNMHLCVMTAAKDEGSCSGDSGGPMQCRGEVAGVTSWGISNSGTCLTTYPSVYARVSHFNSWISGA